MSDSYQAIYDAVRSRIHGGNIADTIGRVAREAFDLGHARMLLQEQIVAVGHDMCRPSSIYRPSLYPDGNQWCALYGEDLATGVAGFGDTPADAMNAFDHAWANQKTPDAIRHAEGGK